MIAWFRRSLAKGFYHQIKLNEIHKEHIKLLERQVKALQKQIEYLEGRLPEDKTS